MSDETLILNQDLAIKEDDSEVPTSEVGVKRVAVNPILARIHPVREVARNLFVCVYGPPGKGKTVFSVAGVPNPLFIGCSANGWDSLINFDITRNTPAIRVEDYRELEKGIIDAVRYGDIDCETVILDDFPELARRTVKDLLIEDKKNPHLPMEHNYKEAIGVLSDIIDKLLRCGKNIVMTLGVAEEEDTVEGSKVMVMRPNLWPSLTKIVYSTFSIVCYFSADMDDRTAEVNYRYIQLNGTHRVVAKNRLSGLPGKMRDPSMPALLAAHKHWLEKADSDGS